MFYAVRVKKGSPFTVVHSASTEFVKHESRMIDSADPRLPELRANPHLECTRIRPSAGENDGEETEDEHAG